MRVGKKELEYILNGACFLASGGGGPLDLGQSCIDANFTDDDFVEVVSFESIKSEEWIVPTSGMGLPSASFNPSELNKSIVNVIEIIEQWCVCHEKDFDGFKYILPMEVGTVNSILPIIACKLAKAKGKNLKVIDADPSGRATPTLPLTLFAGYSCKFYPNFIASGDEIPYFSSYNLESLDHVQECFGQMFTSSAFKNSGGFSLYPSNKENLKSEYIVEDTLTDAYNIGVIIETQNTVETRLTKIISYMNNESKEKRFTKDIFYGTLTKIDSKPIHGEDIGILTIEGLNLYKNNSFKAYTANENIYANIIIDTQSNETEKPYIMGPDSICYLPEVIYKKDSSLKPEIKICDVTQLQELFQNPEVETINLYVVAIDAPKNVKNCLGLIKNWETMNSSLGGEDRYTQPWLK
jgi:DUF917 family protein